MVHDMLELRAARRWMIVGELWALGIEILVLVAVVWLGWQAGPAYFAAALLLACCRGGWRVGAAARFILRVLHPSPPHRERCLWPPRRHDHVR